MKIYLFDLDGVIIESQLFTHGIQENFGINTNFLDKFFLKDFPDCLTGNKDLKDSIEYYLKDSNWILGVDKLLDFWFEFENKVNFQLLNTITQLREKGNICCIASNQEKYRINYIMNNMKLGNYFDKTFFSYILGTKKPDLYFFKTIYSSLKQEYGSILKKEIYFYDDNINNISIGNKFGFNSILYHKDLIIS